MHYCDLEEILAEKRSRKSFLKTGFEAGDVPAVRLSLFCRTIRDSPALASRVLLLKLPYMTRETCKVELARTVSALPNLRYVDLPDGAYSGDHSCHALLNELQARCPDVRRMTYRAGAEASFEQLARRQWQSLEVLEISAVAVDTSTLRIVLASLPTLHELVLSDLDWLDDSVFAPSPSLPNFPPLQRLSVDHTPQLTAQGLAVYLSYPQNREILSELSLSHTGVAIQDLSSVVAEAYNLHHLTIIGKVSRPLPQVADQSSLLASASLRTLHYEISDAKDARGLQRPSQSYYHYLAQSLHSNSLPSLTRLYVREPNFVEDLLLFTPPAKVITDTSSIGSRMSTNTTGTDSSNGSGLFSKNPYRQRLSRPLEIFTKGLDELDWVFTPCGNNISDASSTERRQTHNPNNHLSPNNLHTSNSAFGRPTSTATSRGSGSPTFTGRPVSNNTASRGLSPHWTGANDGVVRKSIIVGNGFGGVQAVPGNRLSAVDASFGVTAARSDLCAGVTGLGLDGSESIVDRRSASPSAADRMRGEGKDEGWLKPPTSLAESMANGNSGDASSRVRMLGSLSPVWTKKENRASRQDLWR